MTKGRTAFIVLMLAAFAVPGLRAQTASGAQPGAGQTIPDLSGIWEAPINLPPGGQTRTDLCGEPTCAKFLKLPRPWKLVTTLEEPQMLPWAEEKYKAARQGVRDPEAFGPDDTNPWFSACMPMGPSELMLSPFVTVEVRQFPDLVLLFFGGTAGEGDHTVRRVYLDGRGHPSNWKPTPMGHSVGHYDGDTLVVDTVGISENSWLDSQGHPQSEALHLVEHIRAVDGNSLEVVVTVDDPQAYKKPWTKKIVRQRASPGPRLWDTSDCLELLQMGTHYGAEARK